MPWFRVCDTLPDHPKAISAKLEAIGLWTLAGAHCRKYNTGGFVSWDVIERLTGGKAPARRIAGRLIEAKGQSKHGLWEPVDGGCQFHDWDKYQQPIADVEERLSGLSAKRSEAGKRGAEKRWQTDGKPIANESQVVIDSDSKPIAPGIPLRLPLQIPNPRTPLPPAAEPSAADENPEWGLLDSKTPESEPQSREQDYQKAYESGVEEAHGRPYAMPENQRGSLHQAMTKHARSREGVAFRGEKLLAWIRFHAAEHARFIEALPAERRQYWPLGPKSMLRWLNDVPPVAEHPASGVHAVTPTERRVAGLFSGKAVPR